VRERGKARGGREGRGSTFYRERGGEGESSGGGEGERSAINGAIRERTWGRREREGHDGFRCGIRTGADVEGAMCAGAAWARRRLAAVAGRRREGQRRVAQVGPTCKGERGGMRGARLGPKWVGFGRLGF
jgi:hypothetical protein